MASILDKVKEQLAPQPFGASISPAPIEQQLQSQAVARSGKAAAPSSSPAEANLAVQLQLGQRQMQQQELAKQQQLAAVGAAADEEVRTRANMLERRKLNQAELDTWTDYTDNQLNLLNAHEQGMRQLSLEKDKAALEQIGFNMRLNDGKYLDRLQREGARSRLDNQYRFQQALQEAVFAEEQDLLSDSLEFQSILNADGREFKDMLANMDINLAIQIAEANAKAANAVATWQGVGELATAAAKGYASLPASSESPEITETTQDVSYTSGRFGGA